MEKYIFQFRQIHCAIWTNTFGYLDEYIFQLRQIYFVIWKIHFTIWTNTFCNLNKYISDKLTDCRIPGGKHCIRPRLATFCSEASSHQNLGWGLPTDSEKYFGNIGQCEKKTLFLIGLKLWKYRFFSDFIRPTNTLNEFRLKMQPKC